MDFSDRVISGTMSNLFFLKENTLVTPQLDRCGICGTMRAEVLELAAQIGIKTAVTNVSLEMVYDADAIFMTNSVWGMRPVAQMAHRHCKGLGKIGETLREALELNLSRSQG